MVDFRSRGKHNRSRRGHVTAHSTVRGARATLVVTRSTRDRVKSEVKIYASVKYRFIGNIMNIFAGNIIVNDFFTIVGYSLPGCDLQ